MTGSGRTQTAPRRRGAAAPPRRKSPARRISLRRRLPRPTPRVLGVLAAVIVLGGGAFMWLRTSSLVAVRQVTITGVSGPDASQIRSALRNAAHGMTTLAVRLGALHTAVAPYPIVKHLRVSTSFPHGMRIRVIEQVPVGEVLDAGRQVPVSADGTILHDASSTAPLPTIALSVPPGGTHIDGPGRLEVALLADAPYTLLAKVAQVSTDPVHGLVAALRNGPRIYFGSASHLTAKWAAAAAVLASPASDGASYIDVTVPARPAAGTGSDSAATATAGTSAGPAGGTSTGSVAGTPTGSTTGAAGAATGASTAPSTAATPAGTGTTPGG